MSRTTSDWISANPIVEMRTALDQALGAPSPAYAAGLAFGQPIKKDHIQELRDRVLAAWNGGGGGVDIRWLVADQLGTPRMVFDLTGSLANVKRHDYLSFGEDLFAGTGNRTTTQGYQTSPFPNDGVRHKFTSYERDTETNLDFAQARYYANTQGRFISVDPMMASARATAPQSWNRYSYVLNKPLNLIDPSGLSASSSGGGCSAEFSNCDEEESGHQGENDHETRLQHTYNAMAATQSARNGDWDTFFDLMASDPTLTVTAWPPSTHDAIIAAAFPGMPQSLLGIIQPGSRQVDWDVLPQTLDPRLAWQYGMVPGPWVEGPLGLFEATEKARSYMIAWRDNLLNKSLNDFAKGKIGSSLLKFGMAMHPMMEYTISRPPMESI